MFIFSFFLPLWVAIFVIIFDLYWICRTIYISYYSIKAYRKLKKNKLIDWWERCQNISDPQKFSENIKEKIESIKQTLEENVFKQTTKNYPK